MTEMAKKRLRIGALQRSLTSNPECQRVLRGRVISDSTLRLLKRHFAPQPGSEIRNRILGNIGALLWLHSQLSLRLLAGGITRGHVMLDDAEKHAYETALKELQRLIGTTTRVLNGDVSDPVEALRDILLLDAVIAEFERRGVK